MLPGDCLRQKLIQPAEFLPEWRFPWGLRICRRFLARGALAGLVGAGQNLFREAGEAVFDEPDARVEQQPERRRNPCPVVPADLISVERQMHGPYQEAEEPDRERGFGVGHEAVIAPMTRVSQEK